MNRSTLSDTTAEALAEKIRSRQATVGVVGLGYVGLPLAVEYAQAGFHVIGIDLNQTKTERVNLGDSYIGDIPSSVLAPLVTVGCCAQPPIFPLSGISIPSTFACRHRCAKLKIRT